ncbi:MAG: hypothetical protein OXB88_06480, partial [Bacteriovoracales bacterium]|nr:hypothetical protein [Bacteriovoracales bacterium]
SQIHNYFLHRMVNEKDLMTVKNTISYLDKASFESLSILPTGTTVLAGLLVQVPILIDIDKIEDEKYEPNNKTIDLASYWELA